MKNKEGLIKAVGIGAFVLANIGALSAITGVIGVSVMTFDKQEKICNDFKSNVYFTDTLKKDMASLEDKYNNRQISDDEYKNKTAYFKSNSYVLDVMKQYEELEGSNSKTYQDYDKKINRFSYLAGAGMAAVGVALITRLTTFAPTVKEEEKEVTLETLI